MRFKKFNMIKLTSMCLTVMFALVLNIASPKVVYSTSLLPHGLAGAISTPPPLPESVNNSVLEAGSTMALLSSPTTMAVGLAASYASEKLLRLILPNSCSAEYYRAQHTSGCWTCLVMEKLISAFLEVANHGLSLTQKAGIILLIIGTGLWLVQWGLGIAPVFNQVNLPSILGALVKMCFKVLLAYWFIIYSATAIGQYFIRPIMSVGAVVAYNMWGGEIKATAEPWDDLSDIDITNDVNKAREEQAKEIEEAKDLNIEETFDEEVTKELNARKEKDEASESPIPAFQMPGTNGRITSFPGCRVPPPTNYQSNCGSFAHMGLDIAATSGSPIWAIAGGTIVYSQSSGWGNMAIVTTKHKGATWSHLYAHMNDADWNKYKMIHASKGYSVARGEIIGGVGSTGQSSGPHLHLEVLLSGTVDGKTYNNDILEPISLAEGKIVVRGKKNGGPTGAVDKASCTCGANGNPGCSYHASWNPATKATEAEKAKNKSCKGFNSQDPKTSYKKGSALPQGGITTPGTVTEVITGHDANYTGAFAGVMNGDKYAGEIPSIPGVNYSGPTNIMPKSVMNSLLNAIKVITDSVAEIMVLGKVIMCYSAFPEGGAWKASVAFGLADFYMVNFIMLLQGFIIFVAGLCLVISIGYYFLDISFKIGFSVLALPIAIGLWPFDKFKDKVNKLLSIMMKASASFAFMALVTSYGVAMISEALGDLDTLYKKIEEVTIGGNEKIADEVNSYISDGLALFSPTFLMMMCAMYYFYKLVSKTVDTITNKFFSDATFGKVNPMHQEAANQTKRVWNYAKKGVKTFALGVVGRRLDDYFNKKSGVDGGKDGGSKGSSDGAGKSGGADSAKK